MARKLDLPASTVASWIRRKQIPSRHIPVVLEKAREHDIQLSVHDFFDLRQAS